MTRSCRKNQRNAGNELHVHNLCLRTLTAPRGLPGFWMVARDAQTNLLPDFESSIWLGGKATEEDKSERVGGDERMKRTYWRLWQADWHGTLKELRVEWGNARCHCAKVRVFKQWMQTDKETVYKKSSWTQWKSVCHNNSENSEVFISLWLVQVSHNCLNIRQPHILVKPVQFPLTVWWQPRLWSDNCHFVSCNQKWLMVKGHAVHFPLFDHLTWHLSVPL